MEVAIALLLGGGIGVATMLDIRWLEDLIVVAEMRNMTKAAEVRNVTQPGLSRRIQSLEYWAGVPLIDRRKSPIDLTSAGYQLLHVAIKTVGRLNGARRSIREDWDENSRCIRFAAPHILSTTFFPRWIPAIQESLGSTRVSVLSDNLPGCVSAFEDGAVDFVVCFANTSEPIIKNNGQLLTIERCAFVMIGHETLIPLSAPNENGVPKHSLHDSPGRVASYLEYDEECSLGWAVEQLVASRRNLSQLKQVYGNSLAEGLRTMALSGLGIAWLPLTTTHTDMLQGQLVRAGDASLDIALEVRLYRPDYHLSVRAEELWMKLTVDVQGMLRSNLHGLTDAVSVRRTLLR